MSLSSFVRNLIFAACFLMLSPSFELGQGSNHDSISLKMHPKLCLVNSAQAKTFSFKQSLAETLPERADEVEACMDKCHWHFVVCTTNLKRNTCKKRYSKCLKIVQRECLED